MTGIVRVQGPAWPVTTGYVLDRSLMLIQRKGERERERETERDLIYHRLSFINQSFREKYFNQLHAIYIEYI